LNPAIDIGQIEGAFTQVCITAIDIGQIVSGFTQVSITIGWKSVNKAVLLQD
jgi:xanthine dehydrogenase molybdopterin-binding subunit B